MTSSDRTRARIQIYRLLSRAFLYPNEESLQALAEESASLTSSLEVLEGEDQLREVGKAFVASAKASPATELEGAYNALFSGRAPCYLNESDYDRNPFARTHRMADAAGFYQGFGMEPSTQAGERPDFIGTELEFMYWLLVKQVYAEEQDWQEEAAVCRDAQAKFFHEHLVWWVPQLCEKLETTSSCTYYRSLATFLKAFIEGEEARLPLPA
ncbi:MAG: molecular chaperone [Anaerolineae bacterium]